MVIKNKDMIQSYVMTAAKYDFSVYEKRILYRIIELLQYMIEGKKLDASYSIDRNLMGDRVVTMPIRYLLKNEDDHNHAKVKKALTSLRNKTIEYDDSKTWKLIGFIEKPQIDKYATAVRFELQDEIYQCLFDFAKGFRKYELTTAMAFETTYAMRFYELFSEVKKPLEYSIAQLKEMFKITGYKNKPTEFIKKVIEPAKKELDKKAPYSFKYTPLKKDGSRSFVSILFVPYFIHENRDPALERVELQKKTSLNWELEKNQRDYLQHNFGFTVEEIKNNLDVFGAAAQKLDFLLVLSKIKTKAEKAENPKGYLINTLKKMLK